MVKSSPLGYHAMDDYGVAYASRLEGEFLGATARNINDLRMLVVCLCVEPICRLGGNDRGLYIWCCHDGGNFRIVDD